VSEKLRWGQRFRAAHKESAERAITTDVPAASTVCRSPSAKSATLPILTRPGMSRLLVSGTWFRSTSAPQRALLSLVTPSRTNERAIAPIGHSREATIREGALSGYTHEYPHLGDCLERLRNRVPLCFSLTELNSAFHSGGASGGVRRHPHGGLATRLRRPRHPSSAASAAATGRMGRTTHCALPGRGRTVRRGTTVPRPRATNHPRRSEGADP
jgi:hypothetical protein